MSRKHRKKKSSKPALPVQAAEGSAPQPAGSQTAPAPEAPAPEAAAPEAAAPETPVPEAAPTPEAPVPEAEAASAPETATAPAAAPEPPAPETAAETLPAAETAQEAPAAPRGRAKALWWVSAAALLVIVLLAFLYLQGVFTPSLATLASSPLSATTQAGGLTLAYPAGFEVLEEDGGVGVYREDVLVRFEDVQQAQERLLEAGYSSAEAAEALLEAGYQLVTGEEAAGMGTVLDQGEGVMGLEFALDSGNAPLRCQLQLFSLQDRLVLGMLVCEQDGLSGGQSLYQALRQGLQLSD